MPWKITKDLLWKPGDYFKSQVGLHTKKWDDKLLKGPLFHFKLYDYDNILYYEGVSTSESFAPLDWAMNDSGCTIIKYKQKGANGKWEILNPIRKRNPVRHCHYDHSNKIRWHSHFGGGTMHEHSGLTSYGQNTATLRDNAKIIPRNRRKSYFGKSTIEKVVPVTAMNPPVAIIGPGQSKQIRDAYNVILNHVSKNGIKLSSLNGFDWREDGYTYHGANITFYTDRNEYYAVTLKDYIRGHENIRTELRKIAGYKTNPKGDKIKNEKWSNPISHSKHITIRKGHTVHPKVRKTASRTGGILALAVIVGAYLALKK